jgi:type II secretory pathway predicted ATPase ExeA
MSLERFGFQEDPFSVVTPDARHVYQSRSYSDALTSLHDGVLAGHGILLLVADSGMGKTTLLQDLKHRLDRVARTVFLSVLDYEPRELLRRLLASFGIDAEERDLAWMRGRLSQILESESDEFRRSVLIIDEAQALPNSTLEGLRLLSNSEKPSAKPVQMVIAGQPELSVKLLAPEVEHFRKRVAVVAYLRALSRSEVNEYIKCRLRLVGYHADGPFTSNALTLIAKWSRGVPARINALCFNALAAADHAENKPLDVSSVRKAIAIVDFGSPAGGIRAYTNSPRARWSTWAVSIGLFMTFTAMLSYRWLISMPTVSAQHGASAPLAAPSVFSNSPAMDVVLGASKAESVDVDTPGRSPESGPGAERIAVPRGSGKLNTFETKIVPVDSESQPANARSTNIVTEIRRGNGLMRQGQYEEAIRAFDAALALGAAWRDVSGKIDRARRAEAAERRVLQ